MSEFPLDAERNTFLTETSGLIQAAELMGRNDFAARIINALGRKNLDDMTPEEKAIYEFAARQLANPTKKVD